MLTTKNNGTHSSLNIVVLQNKELEQINSFGSPTYDMCYGPHILIRNELMSNASNHVLIDRIKKRALDISSLPYMRKAQMK